jgi:predicted amidohydrolase
MMRGNPERILGKEKLLKVAALQMEPHFGDKDWNITESLRMIDTAAAMGAKLMVLPELCNTGYKFNTRKEALSLSEPVPGGLCTEAWIKKASEHKIYLCAGITERNGSHLYNSVVIVGPEGYLGTYRKMHLWAEEKLWFEPGDLGFPVFSLPFGKIGCRICYDVWFPETTRILALQGADIICDSTNWVDTPPIQTKQKPTAAVSAAQMSLMNTVFSVCADRVGSERDCTFIGNSCITDPYGDFIAGPADADAPEVIIAEINLASARLKNRSAMNNTLSDRRVDWYDHMLGYTASHSE